jgi:MoaA/NifB/PqqE/SkfB family radical SAM enzyme
MKKFSWDIGFYCNFKCPYCFFTVHGWDELRLKTGQPRSPDVVEKAWQRTAERYGCSHLYIEGGEPFLYPSFYDIVSRISKHHLIHITTNLSQPLDEFVNGVNPEKVACNATYHPQFMDCAVFARQVLRLRQAGFSCDVCYLAHPQQLREMLNFKRYFREREIEMTVIDFWGEYRGKRYPQAYTDEERRYCRYVARWDGGRENAPEQPGSASAAPAFSPDPRRSLGRNCGAGSDYAVIEVDGTAHPCGQVRDISMGNIFAEGGITLLDAPLRCSAAYCTCEENRRMDG